MAMRRVPVFQQSNKLVTIYNLSKLRNGWLPCREWGEDEQHKQTWLEMGLPEDSRAALHSSISHLQGDPVFHSRRHWPIHLRCHLAKNSHSTLIKTIADTRCRTVPNYVFDPCTVPTFSLWLVRTAHLAGPRPDDPALDAAQPVAVPTQETPHPSARLFRRAPCLCSVVSAQAPGCASCIGETAPGRLFAGLF